MVVIAMSVACGRAAPESARVIRIGYSGESDFGDLPSFVAHARLRAQGYQVEEIHFSASDVAVAAVSRGSVDIINGSMISAWTAISRGARILTIMQYLADPYRLVVGSAVSTCDDLTGRRLGLPAESAVSTHLVRAFIDETCPAAGPEVLIIPEATSRAVAFISGGIDAGVLDLRSLLWLQQQASGRFQVLSNFATRWPQIMTTGVQVNAAFAAAHREMVREYLRALLTATRDVSADPALLVATATDKLGQSEDWSATARAYLAEHVWPDEGGLTVADAQRTLDFFKRYSNLDAKLTVDSVVDVSFLEEAR
jgi:ABC-type nitrate/sulfonate/bicarbonate transport system substrate-binding protein